MLLQINVQNPDTERRRRLPPAPKYENMTPPTNLTRKSQGCQCRICNVSRTKLSQDHKAAIAQFMFSTSSPSHSTSSDPSFVTTQTKSIKCKTWVGKGKPHTCTKATRLENLSNMMTKASPCTTQKLISVAFEK